MSEEKKRTTAGWARAFGGVLREVHPDYSRNRACKGRLIEYIRPLTSGLYVSQNCIAARGSFYNSFAVLLTPARLGVMLYQPFFAGSRFDHNRTIQTQVYEECGWEESRGIHSTHGWRQRAEELVLNACRVAEAKLLPRYLSALAAGKSSLTAVLERGSELAQKDIAELELLRASLDPLQVRRCANVTALEVARLNPSSPEYAEGLDVAARVHALGCKALGSDLSHIIEVVRGL
jgi:hypothetical protein